MIKSDCQESACCSIRLLSPLLPTFKRVNRDTKEVSQLRLRKSRGLSCFCTALQPASAIAATAVVVDAKDAAGMGICVRCGFLLLSASEGKMFLPMKRVAALF